MIDRPSSCRCVVIARFHPRPQTCEYGSKCPKAHSVEELQEWLMRAEEEKEIRHNIGAQGLMSYNESLLEEYKNTSNEAYIVSTYTTHPKVAGITPTE